MEEKEEKKEDKSNDDGKKGEGWEDIMQCLYIYIYIIKERMLYNE